MRPARLWWCGLLLVGAVTAQNNSVTVANNAMLSVVRGNLLETELASAQGGELSVRGPDNVVQRCRFDERTYFERKKQAVLPKTLQAGEPVEIVADRQGEYGPCYARAVRVTDERPTPVRPVTPIPTRSYRSSLDVLFPRGNLTFAGVVTKVSPELLVVKVRNQGEKSFQLRQDTRFLADGAQVTAAALQVNTRVFVRAGKTLDDEVEAFQVMWGDILSTR